MGRGGGEGGKGSSVMTLVYLRQELVLHVNNWPSGVDGPSLGIPSSGHMMVFVSAL